MIKLFALLFSVMMHVLLAVALLYQPVKSPPVTEPGDSPPKAVTLLPKEESITVKIVKEGDKEAKYTKTDEIICDGKDKTYKGIGIIHSVSSPYAILHAPPYYPGYIAGIREGDLVLNPGVQTVNGYVDIEVVRSHNGVLKFHIKVETICFLEE